MRKDGPQRSEKTALNRQKERQQRRSANALRMGVSQAYLGALEAYSRRAPVEVADVGAVCWEATFCQPIHYVAYRKIRLQPPLKTLEVLLTAGPEV